MSVIQVSKIQMRRGAEIDLPGQPTNLAPLTFEPGLDVGEFGYAIDSGRLFIGHDPAIGNPNYNRTAFPYQNIEILTENSEATFRQFQDRYYREINNGFFVSALRLSPVGEWYDVEIDRAGTIIPYRFVGETLVATVTCFVFDEDNIPVRQSIIQVLSVTSESEALMTNSSVAIAGPPAPPPGEDITDDLEFRFIRGGTPSDPHFRFQFRNLRDTPLTLYFSVLRPLP